MRITEFINYLDSTDWAKFEMLATGEVNMGGWEGWLQTEWGMSLQILDDSCVIEREYTYPDRRTRCDFYIAYDTEDDRRDETYIELKCINYKMADPVKKAYKGFVDDIYKIRSNFSEEEPGNGFAIMVSYCTFYEIAKLITKTNQMSKKGIPLNEVKVLRVSGGEMADEGQLSESIYDTSQNVYIFLYNP